MRRAYRIFQVLPFQPDPTIWPYYRLLGIQRKWPFWNRELAEEHIRSLPPGEYVVLETLETYA